jgi:predicted metallo-beta-lactamase superfamily hydrolase
MSNERYIDGILGLVGILMSGFSIHAGRWGEIHKRKEIEGKLESYAAAVGLTFTSKYEVSDETYKLSIAIQHGSERLAGVELSLPVESSTSSDMHVVDTERDEKLQKWFEENYPES